MELPITKYKDRIKAMVKENQVVIIAGETGSGKTTQVPQYLSAYKMCISQPRRISAITLAARVSHQIKGTLGEQVGYSVRFEQKRGKSTRILFATDGMALRQMMVGRGYQLYIVDEAHERSLNTDILMGILKRNLSKGYKLVIMSATIQVQKYLAYFNSSAFLVVEGRSHPISLYYTLSAVSDYVETAINTALQVAFEEAPGNVLVFLTGQQEIDYVCKEIRKRITVSGVQDLVCLPLYSALPSQQQLKVFDEMGVRKIVVSTNIAQTAVTIPDILYIVDCGLVKLKIFDSTKNTEILAVLPESQSNAVQRAGRAGRVAPGKCFRLFTEQTYGTLKPFQTPEIIRTNLRGTVLQLKSLGISAIQDFQLLDRPPQESLNEAINSLISLKALAIDQTITQLGKKMSVLPIDPVFSLLLLRSLEPRYACPEVVLSVVALQGVQSLFYVQSGQKEQLGRILKLFLIQGSDHLTKVNVLHSYVMAQSKKSFCREYKLNRKAADRAIMIRQQLIGYLAQMKLAEASTLHISPDLKVEKVRALLLNQLQVMKGQLSKDNFYRVEGVGMVKVHPESVIHLRRAKPETIVYTEILETNKLYLRQITGQ